MIQDRGLQLVDDSARSHVPRRGASTEDRSISPTHSNDFLVALAVLYRYAPDRAEPRLSWTSPRAVFAAVLWVLGSLLFSIYTANFGKYNETYGALGAVVVLMLWLLLTGARHHSRRGAELRAGAPNGARHDLGPARPLGTRNA